MLQVLIYKLTPLNSYFSYLILLGVVFKGVLTLSIVRLCSSCVLITWFSHCPQFVCMFLSALDSTNLTQHVSFPTHCDQHILDLVITATFSLHPVIDSSVSPSDHFPMFRHCQSHRFLLHIYLSSHFVPWNLSVFLNSLVTFFILDSSFSTHHSP